MYSVIIHYGTKRITLKVKSGNLLDHIRESGIPIGAPCGGKGTCKKCQVNILEEGSVSEIQMLACQYRLSSNIVVKVPEVPEARILTESYWPDIDIQWNKPSKGPALGIAADIGTTTVVVYLENLNTHQNIATRSFLNPQSSYGADVISRIQSVMQQAETLREQKQVIVRALSDAIASLVGDNNLSADNIRQVCIAGNNSMLHFLLGIDPSGLAIYPFTPAFLEEQNLRGEEMGLEACPDAKVRLLPSLSTYVGADIIAGIASTELPDDDEYSLFLDIGTNGEMALGNKSKILTCATAAGPAFEGANISCGLGGVNGAIHSFSGKNYHTIGAGPPSGLCGSGLVDAVAWLLNTGQLDSSGFLEKPVTLLDGKMMADELPLQLTPQDIREVQLAKGAIAAGIQTLISEAGIHDSDISRLYLAGGFGYAMHVETAVRIGLIPASLKDKVISSGNLSGLGARLSLHSDDFNRRIKRIAGKAKYFELSNHMGFNEAFVMKMNFQDPLIEEEN